MAYFLKYLHFISISSFEIFSQSDYLCTYISKNCCHLISEQIAVFCSCGFSSIFEFVFKYIVLLSFVHHLRIYIA